MKADLVEVYFSRVELPSQWGACWGWRGSINTSGYARVNWQYQHYYGHRLAHEIFIGPIPDGLHIDHLCRNRGCVNPLHLEAVTQRENTRRGMGCAAMNARMARCANGHEFSPSNTQLYAGTRRCRVCRNQYYRERREAARCRISP